MTTYSAFKSIPCNPSMCYILQTSSPHHHKSSTPANTPMSISSELDTRRPTSGPPAFVLPESAAITHRGGRGGHLSHQEPSQSIRSTAASLLEQLNPTLSATPLPNMRSPPHRAMQDHSLSSSSSSSSGRVHTDQRSHNDRSNSSSTIGSPTPSFASSIHGADDTSSMSAGSSPRPGSASDPNLHKLIDFLVNCHAQTQSQASGYSFGTNTAFSASLPPVPPTTQPLQRNAFRDHLATDFHSLLPSLPPTQHQRQVGTSGMSASSPVLSRSQSVTSSPIQPNSPISNLFSAFPGLAQGAYGRSLTSSTAPAMSGGLQPAAPGPGGALGGSGAEPQRAAYEAMLAFHSAMQVLVSPSVVLALPVFTMGSLSVAKAFPLWTNV